MSADVRVEAGVLLDFLAAVFAAVGMERDNAAYSAQCLTTTNLWGIDSHGVLRLPIYVQRLAAKVIAANPRVETVGGRGAFEVMSGDDGMGFLVGRAAMDRAVALARENGIGAVSVRNSNHFGAAALYARRATDAGLIGIAMTNVIPNLVVPGGGKPITGNNPVAIGAPSAGPFPFMLDISLSSVAGGKLLLASKRGEAIPPDWATDAQGRPTTDPDVGFKGFLLPVGGHKGFGLSLAVDILCGLVPGGAFQFGLGSMYAAPDDPSRTGHMMIAIDPTVVLGRDGYLERIAAFFATVKASPMWDAAREMLVPGEIEYRTRLEREREGVPLPVALFDDLVALADRHGVARPAKRAA